MMPRCSTRLAAKTTDTRDDRRRGSVTLLALAALLALAPAWGGAAQEAGGATGDPVDAAAEAAAQAEGDAAAQGADATREWLVDDEGKRYFIDKMRKGRFTRLEDDVVKPWRTPAMKIEKEDDEFFYFRVYEQQPVKVWNPNPEVTPEELAHYQAEDLPTVDRLRFQPFDAGLPRAGQWRNGFELADMNGDGHTDLVHTPARKSQGTPVIFLGDDQGNWEVWKTAEFPPVVYDYGDVAVADFNGDSVPDLAVAMHLTGSLATVQDGAGKFRLWSEGVELRKESGDKISFHGKEIAAHDWNRDGRPDLLVLSEGPGALRLDSDGELPASPSGVRLYLNGGDGTWDVVGSPQGDRSFGDALVFGDFDGDGHDDMVTGSRAIGYREVVKLGSADGSWHAAELDVLPKQVLVWSLAVGDLNSDGRPDLVVGYRDNRWGVQREAVDVLINRSEPGKLAWDRRLVAEREGTDRYGAVGAGDVDGDGHLDVVALNGLGGAEVYLGNGDGTFRREVAPELEADGPHRYCDGYEVQLRDLDGDGAAEIVAGFAGEPGGEAYLVTLLKTRCKARGALRVWKAAPAAAGEAAAEGAKKPVDSVVEGG